MYISPNSDLYILKNVNLNSDYDHTALFDTPSLQYSYFISKYKYHLTNQSYQRKERGWLKVDITQNDLLDCTYIMFKNNYGTSTYANKWFYAFITDIQYVNDKTSLLKFEIDELQTWHFNYTLDKCFVEREHTLTDNLFENLVEENLDIGDDFSVQIYRRFDLNPEKVVVIYTSEVIADDPTDPDTKYHLERPISRKIGGFFTGIGLRYFDMSSGDPDFGMQAFGDFLHLYIDNGFEDAILRIYQLPDFITNLYVDASSTESWSVAPSFNNIDGYVPKNNKLFNYPYNFLKLSNNKGSDVVFKHEMWNSISDIGTFELKGVGLGNPCVMCYPCNYRDIPKDYENGLMYTGFNECAWVGDAYQIWLAQNRENIDLAAKIAAGTLLVGGALALGGATAGTLPMLTLPASAPVEIGAGNLLGPAAGNVATRIAVGTGSTEIGGKMIMAGGGGLFGTIYSAIRAKNKLEATPRPAHGHINNDIFNIQTALCGYTCYQLTIRHEYAKIIDEYFSRFGYACREIKIPNRVARRNWTYTKTIGCEINGNIPSESLSKIKSIYDNGITWWRNADNIGNYGDFSNPTF